MAQLPLALDPTMSAVTAQDQAHFDEVFASVKDIEGWMTRDQAYRLWQRAGACMVGDTIVEIGSFHGRSLIVLASSAPAGVNVVAIDPHGGNDRGPQEIQGYQSEAEQDHQRFLTNLTNAGVRERVTHYRMFSNDALAVVPSVVRLLYVDGAHRFRPARADIVQWGAKVALGGTMLVHDSFSSIGVTSALMTSHFVGRQWRYDGRSQSMAQFTRVNLSSMQRVRNTLRGLAQMGYFARNLGIKLLISLKLGRLTPILGGDGSWPY